MHGLLISDLHLTASPRDAYRWRLFDQLLEIIPQNNVKDLFILGDLTEAKDYHSSKLVNRIVDSLLNLYRKTGLLGIHILRGNHDGLDPAWPYFKFLGQYPSIKFYQDPTMTKIGGRDILMLPHTKNPAEDWKDFEQENPDLVFLHATVAGALSESGMALDGIPSFLLQPWKEAKIYSGDVHVPQMIGAVEYVGCPYPVRFGDKFKPRMVLLKDYKKGIDINPDSIRREYVTIPDHEITKMGFKEGDQVKIRIRLSPRDYVDWQKLKKQAMDDCKDVGVELCGLELIKVESQKNPVKIKKRGQKQARSPEEIIELFCKSNSVEDEFKQLGIELIK